MQLPAEQGQKRNSPSLRLTRDQLCQSAALAPRSIRHFNEIGVWSSRKDDYDVPNLQVPKAAQVSAQLAAAAK